MDNNEKIAFLNSLANIIEENAKTPEDASRFIKDVIKQSHTDESIQTITDGLSDPVNRTLENVPAIDIALIRKYRRYLEAWLNIPIEQFEQTKGVSISSSDVRYSKPSGWLTYIPVCAFETNSTFHVSCVPEWEDELRILLADNQVTDVVPRLNDFAQNKKGDGLVESYHKLFALGSPNPQIDTSSAVLLDYSHFNKYYEFKRKVHPSLFKLIDPDATTHQNYCNTVDEKAHFCVIANYEIVCLTESENIPNTPDGIISLGINTLKEYRRKGYATAACAAFIKHSLQQRLLPIWECAFDNLASQMLAEKLGFRHIGNVYSISTLIEPRKMLMENSHTQKPIGG